MTDSQMNNLYAITAGVSHTAALRAIFAAGYAAHAGVSVGASDPSATASFPTNVPVIKNPKNDDHG